jgi:D-alanyl-D-alanine carboxypeptidase
VGARRGTGTLLSPSTQRERLRFLPIPGVKGSGGYGFALTNINGWFGHAAILPGYESVAIYLPSQRATIVALVNTDINLQTNEHLSTVIGEAVSGIITPQHVYVEWGNGVEE